MPMVIITLICVWVDDDVSVSAEPPVVGDFPHMVTLHLHHFPFSF